MFVPRGQKKKEGVTNKKVQRSEQLEVFRLCTSRCFYDCGGCVCATGGWPASFAAQGLETKKNETTGEFSSSPWKIYAVARKNQNAWPLMYTSIILRSIAKKNAIEEIMAGQPPS